MFGYDYIDAIRMIRVGTDARLMVNISGEIVNLPSTQKVKISGETVKAKISGETVKISGQVVKISGEAIKISGEKIYVITKSGDTVNQGSITDPIRHMFGYDYIGTTRFLKVGTDARLLINISGERVKISGEIVKISGETVKISGETTISKISGQVVKISGEVVKISGEKIYVITKSGDTVNQGTIADPTRHMFGYDYIDTARFLKVGTDARLMVNISGERVKISGETVKISGEIVNVAAEDDYDFQSYDLGNARSGTALSLAGASLTIWELNGACEIEFNSTSKPAIPLAAITWPAMITFERDFTNVYLTNTSQASKTLKIYIGKTA